MMKLTVVLNDLTVRLYGDRQFYAHLRDECDRLTNSDNGDYCEFQTIAMSEGDMGIEGCEPKYSVLRVDDEMNFNTAVKLDDKLFDVVFMAIEDQDFEKMK